MQKKENAVAFIINDSYAFAVANLICCIERYDPDFVNQYVVFYSSLSEQNKAALKELVKHIEFIPYSEEYFVLKAPNFPLTAPCIKKWTHLQMAKFELFELLSRYKKVLYLDADMHILGSIRELFENSPMAWRPSSADFRGFVGKFMSIPDGYTMPNGGLIFLTDQISGWQGLTEQCYQLFQDGYKGGIRPDRGQDEIILGILNYKNSLGCRVLPMIYNCPLGGKQTNKAKILHFMGPYKVWKNPILLNMFPELIKNVKRFISVGGKGYDGEVFLGGGFFSKDFGLLASFQTIRNILIWKETLKNVHLELPANIIHSDKLSLNYFQCYLRGFTTKIHYELISDGKQTPVHTVIGFHIEDPSLIKMANMQKYLSKKAEQLNYTYFFNEKTIGIQSRVKNSELYNKFLKFVQGTHEEFPGAISYFRETRFFIKFIKRIKFYFQYRIWL